MKGFGVRRVSRGGNGALGRRWPREGRGYTVLDLPTKGRLERRWRTREGCVREGMVPGPEAWPGR